MSKAGPGSMDIEIQGPVYGDRLENAGPGKIKFVFIPRKEGRFTLFTKWVGAPVRSDQAIVRTPKRNSPAAPFLSLLVQEELCSLAKFF